MSKIVIYPGKPLRVKTKEIKKVDEDLKKQTSELANALADCDNGAGLAALQIGYEKRFFGLKDINNKQVNVYINPIILKTFGERIFPKLIKEDNSEEDFLEGCLSFPDYYGTVKRFLKIKVAWKEIKDEKLVSKKAILSGFDSIVFQHELDHLNGILFVDHIKADNGKFYKIKGKKMINWNVDDVIEGKL